MFTVFVVSDGTAQTAEQLVRAALVQFGDAAVTIERRANVRTPEAVCAVVREAAGRPALICHTLVAENLRRLVLAECRLHHVDSIDLLGPLLERFAARLHVAPRETPGLLRQLVEARSREIEAVAFAFAHDDGLRPEDLDAAEVVLAGVSRTMKTPTMLYLAYRGWFAANVPIIPGLPLPEKLLALPSDRVFGLFPTAEQLQALRRVRAKQTKIPLTPYASLSAIRRELAYAEQLCREHGWRMIDTTGKSVEEICREITALLGGVPGEGSASAAES